MLKIFNKYLIQWNLEDQRWFFNYFWLGQFFLDCLVSWDSFQMKAMKFVLQIDLGSFANFQFLISYPRVLFFALNFPVVPTFFPVLFLLNQFVISYNELIFFLMDSFCKLTKLFVHLTNLVFYLTNLVFYFTKLFVYFTQLVVYYV